MSDIQDALIQASLRSLPINGTPLNYSAAANNAGLSLPPTNDLLDSDSGADRTALGNYLANNGNIHANGVPLSENEATHRLAQIFSNNIAASRDPDAGLFTPQNAGIGRLPDSILGGPLNDPRDPATVLRGPRTASGEEIIAGKPLSSYAQQAAAQINPAGNTEAQIARLSANNAQLTGLPDSYRSQYAYANGSGLIPNAYGRARAVPVSTEGAATANETKALVKSVGLKYDANGTIDGKANGNDFSSEIKKDSDNLINANKDLPGGFQLGNKRNSSGSTDTFNGTIDGKKVLIEQNGDGPIKVTVDGKEVKKGEKSGPVDFQNGGPGDSGIVKLTGKNDATGAKIETSITKSITEEEKEDTGKNVGKGIISALFPMFGDKINEHINSKYTEYKHVGLNMSVDSATGPNGSPLSLGGDIGAALTK